jgi:hypothetical protein
MEMELFNVLIKGVEVKDINFCKVFLTEKQAHDYINETCLSKNWVQKSSMGWNENNTIDDVRVEDIKGNTYYFVIYRQFLDLNNN